MATKRARDSASRNGRSVSRNGPATHRRVIEEVEVDRFVLDFSPNTRGSFTDSKVQVRFVVKAVEAKAVSVVGTFNGWDANRTPLSRNGDAWEGTIAVTRGKHEYRFIVDGQWVSDPNALESIANPYGSHNSVLSV